MEVVYEVCEEVEEVVGEMFSEGLLSAGLMSSGRMESSEVREE